MGTRPKRKVRTHNKSYSLDQSPLYKMNSIKKLALLLNTSKKDLKTLASNSNSYYSTFYNEDKRLIQTPNKELYEVHYRISDFLARIATPKYLHSKKRSSYISNAELHLNSRQVITFDISSFFQSITQNTIRKFFLEKLKCSPDISFLLSQICSIHNHLPTGSPISFYLSFLANIDMFDEMARLANNRKAKFSVYVDDVTISGVHVDYSLLNTMEKIVKRHGYNIKKIKTNRYTFSETPIITGIALHDGSIASKNSFMRDSRNKVKFLKLNMDALDNDTLLKEYNSLQGKNTYLRSINASIPANTLQVEQKLKKLTSNLK